MPSLSVSKTMPNLHKINHNDLVIWLENHWREKASTNLKVYRELEECPEFQQDLKNAQSKDEFYHYGSLPSDLVVIEKKYELPDVDSDAQARRHRANFYKLFFIISSAKE